MKLKDYEFLLNMVNDHFQRSDPSELNNIKFGICLCATRDPNIKDDEVVVLKKI